MPEPLQLLSAALVGLLGGVHCVGMCGGVVGALAFTLPPERRGSLGRTLPYLRAYNAGRITSYVVAGAAFGAVGAAAVSGLGGLKLAEAALSVLAGAFMVVLGLYLAGWWQGLARLEQAGSHLWRRLVPVRSVRDAWLLGVVWGWLPCGLVYSVLVWALSAGSAVGGGLLMASFGVGTLPTLLALGAAAARLTPLLQRPAVRAVAGALVAAFGVVQLWRGLAGL